MRMRAYPAILTAAVLAAGLALPATASALTFTATSTCDQGTVTVTAKFTNVADAEKPIAAQVDTTSAERGKRVLISGFSFNESSGVLTITVPDAIKNHHGALEGGDNVTAWFHWHDPATGALVTKLYLNDFSADECYPGSDPWPAQPLTAREAKAAVRGTVPHPQRWRLRTLSTSATRIVIQGHRKKPWRRTMRYFTATRQPSGLVKVVRSRWLSSQ